MKRNKRKHFGPCYEPEATIIATVAHLHGAVRFNFDSLAIPGMTQEAIKASLLALVAQGYLRCKGVEAWLTGAGLRVGLALYDIYRPGAQTATEDEPQFALFTVHRSTGATEKFHPDCICAGAQLRMENIARELNFVRSRVSSSDDEEIQALPLVTG